MHRLALASQLTVSLDRHVNIAAISSSPMRADRPRSMHSHLLLAAGREHRELRCRSSIVDTADEGRTAGEDC